MCSEQKQIIYILKILTVKSFFQFLKQLFVKIFIFIFTVYVKFFIDS
jgi:hypothetical protein